MRIILAIAGLIFSLGSCAAETPDDENINEIYRLFLVDQIDLAETAERYNPAVIHVGAADTPLIVGRDALFEKHMAPIAEMIASGALSIEGKFYIVRRVIGAELAHDVGYFYSRIEMDGQPPVEAVQKYSWVLENASGKWRVITDFDGTPAPLSVLENLETQLIIGAESG